eukprot:72760-Pleurochrysis_carterae.AAC.2
MPSVIEAVRTHPAPSCFERVMNILTCGAFPLAATFLTRAEHPRVSMCARMSNDIYKLDSAELISHPQTDAQASVHLNTPHGSIVVFRGSQSRRDWVMNVLFRASAPFHASGVRCHLGFKLQWESVKYRILEELKHHDSSRPVTLTGHSLGAGVATLAALELYAHGFKVCLVTFGSPRAVNPAGADLFKQRGIPCLRFRNGSDVVTSIPLINLRHVSDPILIGPARPAYYAASLADHDMEMYERNVRALFHGAQTDAT